MKTRWIIIAAAGGAIALALHLHLDWPSQHHEGNDATSSARSPSQSPTAAPELEARLLRNQVTRLESRLQGMELRYQELDDDLAGGSPSASESEPSDPVEADSPGPMSEEERRARLERTIAHNTEVLEGHLASEPVAAQWSEKTHDEIEGFLAADDLAGVTLTETECRTTLCRVELSFADEGAARDFIAKASRTHPWKYSAQMVPLGPDNLLAVNLYIGREGHPLPPL